MIQSNQQLRYCVLLGLHRKSSVLVYAPHILSTQALHRQTQIRNGIHISQYMSVDLPDPLICRCTTLVGSLVAIPPNHCISNKPLAVQDCMLPFTNWATSLAIFLLLFLIPVDASMKDSTSRLLSRSTNICYHADHVRIVRQPRTKIHNTWKGLDCNSMPCPVHSFACWEFGHKVFHQGWVTQMLLCLR